MVFSAGARFIEYRKGLAGRGEKSKTRYAVLKGALEPGFRRGLQSMSMKSFFSYISVTVLYYKVSLCLKYVYALKGF
ncbi:hypothetical protein HMPREF1986_01990 [Oribacterium sp. oral taxon 078 str. F0263]|nr:hypothetical protein GCWU000341_00254 [Oribacterium sp. oral taxon 078 str. F0262]ERL20709.1 hypothetical protein HMPREF1986_01990 [Oribacterium sp. oral taxon 078 str. F0263]